MKIFASILIAVIVAAPAYAGDFMVKPLATMRSAPGADKITFLASVGKTMRAFSDRTGFESCAEIATDGTSYGVNITTSRSHIGCAIEKSNVPDGMHSIGETIHSHGNNTAFQPNRSDREFLHMGFDPRAQVVTVGGQDPYNFSAQDYSGRPGYLATPAGLKFQHGAGTSQDVR